MPASQLIGGTNTVTVFAESLMDEPFFDGLGEDWATDSGRAERAILHQVELTVEYEAVAQRVGVGEHDGGALRDRLRMQRGAVERRGGCCGR